MAKSAQKQAHKVGAISVRWPHQAEATGTEQGCQIITRWCQAWRQDKTRKDKIAEEPSRLVWQMEPGNLGDLLRHFSNQLKYFFCWRER